MQKDPAVFLYYAPTYASSANYWKNAIGMNEGLVKLNIFDIKKEQETKLLERGYLTGTDAYKNAFEEITEIVKQRRGDLYHQQAIGEALVNGMPWIMRIPSTESLAKALKENNAAQISQSAKQLHQNGSNYFGGIKYPEIEKHVSKEMLKTYAKYIPESQRISIFSYIKKRFGGDTDKFVDYCFANAIFGNPGTFAKFIQNPTLKALEEDPMIMLKQSITEGAAQTAAAQAGLTNRYNKAHKTWVKGMMELKDAEDQPLYPDANSTMRLTYGKVLSYTSDGKHQKHYTTLKGVMDKEDPDNYEFIVPAKLKELYNAKDYGRYAMKNGEMPVCFIINTDQTGGNSGSPVFNGKGQLIGVGFDRNVEGLTGDIAYKPDTQRAICVDIRYVLFIIDKYANCQRLLNELTIE